MPFRLLFVFLLCFVTAATQGAPTLITSPRASVLLGGGAMMNQDHFADSTLPALRAHFAGCKRIALVLHATHPTERDAIEARMQKAFAHLGRIEAESLHHFDDAGARDFLQKADAIWVGGGETFVLLAELNRSGQIAVIRERVLAGVPFGGSSAGANVAGLLIGTTNDFPVVDLSSRDALAIFPAVINPHHPLPGTKPDYEARSGKIRSYLKFNPATNVLALANTAVVRWHGGRVTLESGRAWLYTQSGVRELPVGEEVLELAAKH